MGRLPVWLSCSRAIFLVDRIPALTAVQAIFYQEFMTCFKPKDDLYPIRRKSISLML
jgi:hypothetical protein